MVVEMREREVREVRGRCVRGVEGGRRAMREGTRGNWVVHCCRQGVPCRVVGVVPYHREGRVDSREAELA